MLSLKRLLMPAISQRLLSRDRLLQRRRKAEQARLARGERHVVHYFHQVDDPYSALAAASLPALLERYDIDLVPHIVGAPPDSAAPDRARLIDYSRRDAQLLARRWQLDFTDSGMQPGAAAIEMAGRQLVGAIDSNRFTDAVTQVTARLWTSPPHSAESALASSGWPSVEPAAAALHLERSNALRQRMGHYLGATFFHGGEWYWGIDRLHHLEQRLQDLGAQRAGVQGALYPPGADLDQDVPPRASAGIDFFFSLRSPYSAIVAPRVFALGQHTGVPVRLRFVLPMVMRGLAVPREKRAYIALDAAREAWMRGIPFGRVNDPVGRPTERGLALIPLAERQGKGQAYVLSFMNAVWARGIDAGSDRGLRQIAEGAGLAWSDVQQALEDNTWRTMAEANRQELLALGLWGVPSFRVGDTAVWGQDRLWAVQDALQGQP